jgi:hypothetical protein
VKSFFRKLFAPLLSYFESGNEMYSYKPSHRTILIVVGGLFMFLAGFGVAMGVVTGQFAAMFPAAVFFVVASVCFIVGMLGNERAVAKIWGSR